MDEEDFSRTYRELREKKKINWYFLNVFFILMFILFWGAYLNDLKFKDYQQDLKNYEDNNNIQPYQSKTIIYKEPIGTTFKKYTAIGILLVIIPLINLYYISKLFNKK